MQKRLRIITVIGLAMLFGACGDVEEETRVGEDVGTADDDISYFSEWDADADGYVHSDEFATGPAAATRWEEWDTDRDDYLSQGEFGRAFTPHGWYDEGLFGEWDEDADDRLSQDEWRRGLHDTWDADDDERLSESEYDKSLFE